MHPDHYRPPPPQYTDAVHSPSPTIIDVPTDPPHASKSFIIELESPPTHLGKFYGYIYFIPLIVWAIYGQRKVTRECYTIYNVKRQIVIWILAFFAVFLVLGAAPIGASVLRKYQSRYEKTVCQTHRMPGSLEVHEICDTISDPYTPEQLREQRDIVIVIWTCMLTGMLAVLMLISLYARQNRIKHEQAHLQWNTQRIRVTP